jgi:hypothetical protein
MRGYTTDDLAKRFRVSPDKVRGWITSGKIRAINTADTRCSKPRYVVTPEALAEFERQCSRTPPPKQKRAKRRSATVDYFPD